jgi:hypothetical protein
MPSVEPARATGRPQDRLQIVLHGCTKHCDVGGSLLRMSSFARKPPCYQSVPVHDVSPEPSSKILRTVIDAELVARRFGQNTSQAQLADICFAPQQCVSPTDISQTDRRRHTTPYHKAGDAALT